MSWWGAGIYIVRQQRIGAPKFERALVTRRFAGSCRVSCLRVWACEKNIFGLLSPHRNAKTAPWERSSLFLMLVKAETAANEADERRGRRWFLGTKPTFCQRMLFQQLLQRLDMSFEMFVRPLAQSWKISGNVSQNLRFRVTFFFPLS